MFGISKLTHISFQKSLIDIEKHLSYTCGYMKDIYGEYSTYSDEEMAEIWRQSIVVVDTNVILDFYCFGQQTLADYYKVLNAIKDSGNLWMPHQVGYEFYENREGIINRQKAQYERIIAYIDEAKEKISGLSNNTINHAQLDFADIANQYDAKVKTIKSKMQRAERSHPDYISDDAIVNELEQIYSSDIIGPRFSAEQLEILAQEGELRYSKQIPPGYKDAKKDDKPGSKIERKYGDLIIWKQIIDEAKKRSKPVIFVTNDSKEDWVRYSSDKKRLGPKTALRRELLDEAGVDFFLLSSDDFLTEAHRRLDLSVDNASVQEVKRYRELEHERMRDLDMEIDMNMSGAGPHRRSYEYINKAVRLVADIQAIMFEIAAPQRAILTMKEVSSIYRYMKMAARHATSISTIEEPLMKIDFLVRRCENIMDDLDERVVHKFKILEVVNRYILESFSSRQTLQERLHFAWNAESDDEETS
jgi:hypothetical protein